MAFEEEPLWRNPDAVWHPSSSIPNKEPVFL